MTRKLIKKQNAETSSATQADATGNAPAPAHEAYTMSSGILFEPPYRGNSSRVNRFYESAAISRTALEKVLERGGSRFCDAYAKYRRESNEME